MKGRQFFDRHVAVFDPFRIDRRPRATRYRRRSRSARPTPMAAASPLRGRLTTDPYRVLVSSPSCSRGSSDRTAAAFHLEAGVADVWRLRWTIRWVPDSLF